MVQESNSFQSEKSCWLFSQRNGAEEGCLSDAAPTFLGPTNMVLFNFAFNPHSGLKELTINLMFPSPVMKLPTNRSYDRLFV